MIALNRARPIDRLPPGPEVPQRIQGREAVTRPVAALEALRRAYGPIFTVNLPGMSEPLVVLGASELVKPFMEAEGDQVVRAQSYSWFFKLNPAPLLITMQGERHTRLRRVVTAMLNAAAAEIGRCGIEDIVDRTVEDLSNGEGVVDLRKVAELVMRRISAWLFFGPERIDEMAHRYALVNPLLSPGRAPNGALQSCVGIFDGLRDGWHTLKIVRTMHQTLGDWPQEEHMTPMGQAYLQRAEEVDREYFQKHPVKAIELGGLLSAVYAGGTSSLEHQLYAWSKESAARDSLQDAFESGCETTMRSSIDAFAREVRRLWPDTVGYGRITRAPLQVGDWTLPAGVRVVAASVLVQRDPKVFEQPTAFRPERFIDRTYLPHEYFPFGAGSFRCVGRTLANALADGILRALVNRYSVTPLSGHCNRITQATILTRHSRPILAELRRETASLPLARASA